jgi:hypothetical protein
MGRMVDQTADKERWVLKNTNSHAQQAHVKCRGTNNKQRISEWYTLYTYISGRSPTKIQQVVSSIMNIFKQSDCSQ